MTAPMTDPAEAPAGGRAWVIAFCTAVALIVGLTSGYIVAESSDDPEVVGTAAADSAASTPDATSAAVDADAPTTRGHDHGGQGNPMGDADWTPEPILDPAVQAELSSQMVTVDEVTMRYPTVADAEAAGMRPVGTFSAGSGAHYLSPGAIQGATAGGMGTFDVDSPIIYLYAGNDPTSPVVGLMYYLFSDEPEGFAGPNDHWHQHSGLCLGYSADAIDIALPVDQDATRADCDAVDGQFMDSTGWMVHVWSAPGWEAPEGVFAHDNSLLVCTDGTPAEDVTLDVGCEGMAGVPPS